MLQSKTPSNLVFVSSLTWRPRVDPRHHNLLKSTRTRRRPRVATTYCSASQPPNPKDIWVRVKTAIPLSTAFADYLGTDALVSAGPTKFKVVCPFHNDKNPSLFIDDQKGTFHCFACGAGGTIIDFQQLRSGHRSVAHALKDLAASYPPIASILRTASFSTPNDTAAEQVERPVFSKPNIPRRVIVTHKVIAHEVLRETTILYQRAFWDPSTPEALSYMIQERRISKPTLKAFGCGYARPSDTADFALSHLLSRSHSAAHAVIAGVARSPEEGTAIDVLRNRIVTPIRDKFGAVISLAGRVMPGAPSYMPKYVNGPETVLFKKSQVLFGADLAHRAPSARSERGYVVVVEGYMDAMTLFDSTQGRVACVATMGTSTSVMQLNAAYGMLADIANGRIILNFDADDAGIAAILRICEKVIPKSECPHAVYVAQPPPPMKDPDEFLRLIGKADEYIDYLLETAVPWYEWQGDRIVRAEVDRLIELESRGQDELLNEERAIDRDALSLVETSGQNFDFIQGDYLREQRDDMLVAFGAPEDVAKFAPTKKKKYAECSDQVLEELADIIVFAHQCLPGLNVSALAQSWADTLSRGRSKALFAMYGTIVKRCEELSRPWRELSVPEQVKWMPPPPWAPEATPKKKKGAIRKAMMRGESGDSFLDEFSNPKFLKRSLDKVRFQDKFVMSGLRQRQCERSKMLKIAPRRSAEELILQTLIFATEIDRLDAMEKLLGIMIRCQERGLPFWTSREREELHSYLFRVEGSIAPEEMAAYAEDNDWWNEEIEALFTPLEEETDPEWQGVRGLFAKYPVQIVESTATSVEAMAGKVASFLALQQSETNLEQLISAASKTELAALDEASGAQGVSALKELLAKQVALKKDVDQSKFLSPDQLAERDEGFRDMLEEMQEQRAKEELLSELEEIPIDGDPQMPLKDLSFEAFGSGG